MTLVKSNRSLFPSIWSGFFDDDWLGTPNAFQAGTSVPAVNIKDTADGYEVEMAVPGMKKDDFHIDLDNNLLSISAEEKQENAEKDDDGNYTRREFSYKSFKRSFTLPESVASEKISAKYTDGVLYIVIPKKEEAKPKPIKVIEIK